MNNNVKPSLYILLLSGPIAVGKTSIADRLVEQQGFARVRSGAFLQQKAHELGLSSDRTSLQALGDEFDNQTDYRWIVDEVILPALGNNPSQTRWLIDAVRKSRQVEHIRFAFGTAVVHLHLCADENTLKMRYEARVAEGEEYFGNISYQHAIEHPNEVSSRSMREIADFVIDVEGMQPQKVIEVISDKLFSTA